MLGSMFGGNGSSGGGGGGGFDANSGGGGTFAADDGGEVGSPRITEETRRGATAYRFCEKKRHKFAEEISKKNRDAKLSLLAPIAHSNSLPAALAVLRGASQGESHGRRLDIRSTRGV